MSNRTVPFCPCGSVVPFSPCGAIVWFLFLNIEKA